MEQTPQYRAAADLEAALGDPRDDACTSGFAVALEDDEREVLPERGLRALSDWGLARHFVPVAAGGALDSFDELAMLMRVVARRDLTVAIATGQTFLGTVGVWIAGDDAQKRHAAQVVLGNGAAALALSEREHGSDIVAGEVKATPTAAGFVLDGTKWLINNATRGRLLSVLARTQGSGGLRGFSLFLVDKEQLGQGTYQCLPKIKTHGIRGADISGIRFAAAVVGEDAVLRRKGAGLDIVLRSLCVTRTLCSSFSLGAFDTALRTTLEFATMRRLYGASMLELHPVRRALVDSLIDLVTCECVALSAVRSLHVAPEQVSVNSAVVKYFVPTLTEAALQTLSAVLGARYYLRAEWDHGIFQKMLRDNAVVGLFDGSTAVNLTLIAQQLGRLSKPGEDRGTRPDMIARNRATFGLAEPLAAFAAERLALDSQGSSDVLDRLGPDVLHEVRGLPGPIAEGLIEAVNQLVEWRAEFNDRGARLSRELGAEFSRSEAAFDLAREYCALHAAAACLWIWLHNRERWSGIVRRGDIVVLALQRLLQRHGRARPRYGATTDVLGWLGALQRNGELFSLVRFPLATSAR